MLIIGITGGTGTGKSFIAEHYKNKGGFIIDADKLAHSAILKGTPAYDVIVKYFGNEIKSEDEEINRRKLGKIVFNDSEALEFLVQVTHCYVIERTNELIKSLNNEPKGYLFVLIDAPLLIEANMHKICDKVIITTADLDTRIKRVMQRDNKTYDEVVAIINKQTPFCNIEKYGDHFIQTDIPPDELKKVADTVLSCILL